MKNAIILLSICLVVFLAFSCKTKQYTLEDHPDPNISFGSGGGFTGMYTHYIIYKNGQLFKKGGTDENYSALPNADKNEALQVFKNYEILQLDEVKLNEPGNMSYYIEYKDKDGEHKLTWGGTNQKPSDEVKLFYQILNKIVKTASTDSDASKS